MESRLVWRREVLSNGLTVLSYPRPSGLTAQVAVAIKYGSNDDADGKAGNAHFLEHLTAGGSKRRIGLHHEIEKLGGNSSFETDEELTFCSMDVLPGKVVNAAKVLSELVFDPVFEVDKIEIERKVILNEIDEAHDDPSCIVDRMLVKSLFKHHPLRNDVLGTAKTVKQLASSDFVNAHENCFTPKNMVLILTGNFSQTEKEAILDNFQRPGGNFHRQRREPGLEAGKPRAEVAAERSGLNQAYLALGCRTAPVTGADTPALDLLEVLLGAGESSRLFVELREKRALTYDFDANNTAGGDFGYFSVDCAVKMRSLEVARRIFQEELQKIGNVPPGKGELEKGMYLLQGRIYRTIDIPAALPRLLAYEEIHFGSENSLVDYVAKLNLLRGEDLADVAHRYFRPENYATAILKPKR